MNTNRKGLEIARSYYYKYGESMIKGRFSKYIEHMAVGLVGEGSECFGFDDLISRDHDYGPGFCIWLPEHLYAEIGEEMQAAYDMLPKEYGGLIRNETAQGRGRVGVLSTQRFYQRFTGVPGVPANNSEWLRVPETYLATATNGEVFFDNDGTFSAIRDELKQFYPEVVREEKLAARAITMAQSGQYNYPRCLKREDRHTAYLACGEFVNAALSAVFLLNKVYMPFYKWAFKMANQLESLQDTVSKIKSLTTLRDHGEESKQKVTIIEDICMDICRYFNRTGLTEEEDHFLAYHGEELLRRIK